MLRYKNVNQYIQDEYSKKRENFVNICENEKKNNTTFFINRKHVYLFVYIIERIK